MTCARLLLRQSRTSNLFSRFLKRLSLSWSVPGPVGEGLFGWFSDFLSGIDKEAFGALVPLSCLNWPLELHGTLSNPNDLGIAGQKAYETACEY
jgi:hypothetical protein